MSLYVSLDADRNAFDTVQISVGSDMRAAGITMNISPNPSNGKVAVDISTPEALVGKAATLTIVDMLGKSVTTLYDGKLSASSSHYSWQPDATIAEGVYTLIATINGKNYTQQIVRMK